MTGIRTPMIRFQVDEMIRKHESPIFLKTHLSAHSDVLELY